jgi:anti-sigma factor RsiW
MKCRSAESLFSSYIEDEISQEERRALEAHFMGCRRCTFGMREVRATMLLMERMPQVAPSAHFDEDVFARIRSGEGLRPSPAELIRELFSPARLRPAFMVGAGVCAVFIAVMLSPVGQGRLHPKSTNPDVSIRGLEPTASAPREMGPSAPAAPVSVTERAAAPANRDVAPVVASVPTRAAMRDSVVDGMVPQQRYMDEIINDKFYLERGPEGQDPTVVPVNQTPDDGVYIIF